MATILRNRSILPFLITSFLCISTIKVHSQLPADVDSNQKLNVFSAGAGLQYGFIFAHTREVENTKGARPIGAELMLSWQRNDASAWKLCNCFPRKGLAVSYYNFDQPVLGKGITGGFFLEPVYRLSNKLLFSVKAVGGFAYLSNPFDSLHNPTNQSYSTDLSGYLLLGTGAWIQVSSHWWANVNVNYQHTSNGGFRDPNKGINWPTAGIAFHYYPKAIEFYKGSRTYERNWKQKPLRWDAGIFGIARKQLDENGNSRRVPLLGVHLQTSKQIGRIQALTAGAELYRDRALQLRLKRDTIEGSATRASLLVGHEFLLGKFIFSQRLGVYVYHNSPYFTRLHHRWGMQYYTNKGLGVGFHLNAHKQVAEFVDLRLSYTWRGESEKGKVKSER